MAWVTVMQVLHCLPYSKRFGPGVYRFAALFRFAMSGEYMVF